MIGPHFLTHAVSERPLLLLLDGHSPYYTLDLVKAAAEKDVIIFCLPSHTTADSQPLDTSYFGPLKHTGLKYVVSMYLIILAM